MLTPNFMAANYRKGVYHQFVIKLFLIIDGE